MKEEPKRIVWHRVAKLLPLLVADTFVVVAVDVAVAAVDVAVAAA